MTSRRQRWSEREPRVRRFLFFQAEDGIRDHCVTGVQTCALPISIGAGHPAALIRHSSKLGYVTRTAPSITRAAPYLTVCPTRLSKVNSKHCPPSPARSEEHTSELQSHSDLVCRLLLEKKKNTKHK